VKPLLRVAGLVTEIGHDADTLRVVDGVSFHVVAGETYALLGESGCGKSMTALSLMRLLPDGGRIVAGAVQLDGQDVLALPECNWTGRMYWRCPSATCGACVAAAWR